MITLMDGELYQWDTGRVVVVEPDNDYDIHEVHFTTKKLDFAYVVNTYSEGGNIYCAIPNILLQQYQDIVCYEVRENDEGEESVSSTTFDVIKRNRPVDYVYTETEKYTYKDLNRRVTALEEEFAEMKETSTEASVMANQAYEVAETAQAAVTTLNTQLEELSSAAVKTINNIAPDENGNITIEAGSGSGSVVVDSIVEF